MPNPMEQSREGHLSIAPWSERYETGIGILDLQHQELFEFIETLAASFREGAATQKIRLALKFLASYTVNHFKTEEAFMKEMGYPSFMAHVAEHSQLFAKVRHFQTSLMEGEAITMEVAAFLAEPILGVGGFMVPPKEYFQVAVEIVRRYGGLFIADEVQTGWGRTGGKWFGIEHFNVVPDIMTSAKGMANGIPIGWTVTTDKIAEGMKGLTISTFGGNPVSCVAAHATIDAIQEEGLLSHVEKVGAYLREHLLALQKDFPGIGDVRGMGLMLGVEFVADRKTKAPDAKAVARIFEETKKEGLLIGKGGLYGNVLRISPPMCATKGDVDDAIKRLRLAF